MIFCQAATGDAPVFISILLLTFGQEEVFFFGRAVISDVSIIHSWVDQHSLPYH